MSQPEAKSRPRNAIAVLLDGLNRRMLGAYGAMEFDTPHLDRLARQSSRGSTMPIPYLPEVRLPRPDRCARLGFTPGTALGTQAIDRLRAAFEEVEAPPEQLMRIGLA